MNNEVFPPPRGVLQIMDIFIGLLFSVFLFQMITPEDSYWVEHFQYTQYQIVTILYDIYRIFANKK